MRPRQTLELARVGNLDAYREFVPHERRSTTVFRLVGCASPPSQDITQDVFIKLFRALPQFDPGRGTKLSSWVFTFVKNYCFDVLKRRRRPTVSLDAGEDRATIPIRRAAGRATTLNSRRSGGDRARSIAAARAARLAFVLREYEGSRRDRRDLAVLGEPSSRASIAREALRFRLRRLLFDTEGDLSPGADLTTRPPRAALLRRLPATRPPAQRAAAAGRAFGATLRLPAPLAPAAPVERRRPAAAVARASPRRARSRRGSWALRGDGPTARRRRPRRCCPLRRRRPQAVARRPRQAPPRALRLLPRPPRRVQHSRKV
jgi:DNA-directed RNA polymerase specialized sigma24 family protein